MVAGVAAATHAQPEGSGAPRWRVRVAAAGSAPAASARRVEQEVLGEAFGDDPAELERVYGPSEPLSVFVLVEDEPSGVAVGMVRVVVAPRDAGDLPSVEGVARSRGCSAAALVADAGVDPRAAADVAVLAVRSRWRGDAAATVALFQALSAVLRQAQARWLVAVVDQGVLAHLQRLTCGVFSPWPGVPAGPFLGSPESVPVVADLPAWVERLRRECPEVYRRVWWGVGDHRRWRLPPPAEVAAAVSVARAYDAGDVPRG